ncbi:MAG: hypothetical protein ACKVOX_00345 [Rhizobacter sp.]
MQRAVSLIRTLCVSLILLALSEAGLALVLPEGLAVDPPESVDLTQQVITTTGDERQVLAAWDGDTLRYFIRVERLPPGPLDVPAYYSKLVSDLRASGLNVEADRRGDYPIGRGLQGSYLVVDTRRGADARLDRTVVHLITDGKVAFVAVGRLTAVLSADQLIEETVALFKTARIAEPELPSAVKPRNR